MEKFSRNKITTHAFYSKFAIFTDFEKIRFFSKNTFFLKETKKSAGLSKLPSTSQENFLRKTVFFLIFDFLIIFGLGEKNWTFGKNFRQGCQNWIVRVQRNIFRKNSFFWWKDIFLIIWGFWAKNFRLLAKFFQKGCQNLVLNRLLDSYYIFVENTKPKKSILIRNFCNGVQGILTAVHPWAQGIFNKAIPGHRAFLLRPSMEPGLSWQFLVMGVARDRAVVQGCVVVTYHWGG